MKIKYSIIIPHKNDASNLKKLIESLCDLRECEILIIDDHSTLSEREKLDILQRKYTNVMISCSNITGAGAARNLGISIARGQWLIFADSDDRFDREMNKKISKYFESNYDVIYFKPIIKVSNQNDYRFFFKGIFDRYLLCPVSINEWTIRLNFDVPWSKMIRTQYVKQNDFQFSNSLKQNDTMFSEMVGINAHSVKISDSSIYAVIDRASSTSHQLSKEYFESSLKIIIESYIYKRNHVATHRLIESDMAHFHSPLYAILLSLKHYKSVVYTYRVYSLFKKNKIPIFTWKAYRSLIRRSHFFNI
ncbi:MAG: glycosyltransferase family 2 protein [Oenococcus sp.]|uniref:glycosyltransferase family 2 protein n=1 Tax=Oenococcus sp. TaxID=1979414 RepID=UPI0039EBEF20